MKTYLTLFIVACQSVVALAQDNENKTPYLTKSLANDAISSVTVSTSAGGINVSGRTGEAPRIEVYIRGNNGRELSKEEIKKHLDEDYEMNISVNGHELSAIVKNRHNFTNWKESMSISFKIYVPQQVSTNLKTSGGGIHLDNLKGDENFSTSGGGLQIERLTGMIHGRTSGGGIDVSNSSDNIDLVTSGGGITAKDCEGKIKLVTSGGGLRLENLKGTIYAHTSGGGVEGSNIEGELVTGTSGGGIDLKEMACSLEANTSAGSLRAEMKKVGKYLKVSTSAGNIDLELPQKQGLDLNLRAERINDHILSGFTGEWKKDYVNGSINGGGVPVDAHASSGDINVKFN
jgi:Putative adhesin